MKLPTFYPAFDRSDAHPHFHELKPAYDAVLASRQFPNHPIP